MWLRRCKRCVRLFRCPHLRYLTTGDSKSYCFHSVLVVTLCVGVRAGNHDSEASRAPSVPWGRGDTYFICHWTIIHQTAGVLTPNQLLSFLKGQSANLSAAKQGRKI